METTANEDISANDLNFIKIEYNQMRAYIAKKKSKLN